ncbi:MAG: hypothetical protein R3C39_07815 [Dehalococcoidia bacterium]
MYNGPFGYAMMAIAYGFLGYLLVQSAIFLTVYIVILARTTHPLIAFMPAPVAALTLSWSFLAIRDFADGLRGFIR